ncbi:hypothetical protein [Amycolatopsis saalfeldensis]|nr:hypothetical protein [Amycolatopsis saalfeldensis]
MVNNVTDLGGEQFRLDAAAATVRSSGAKGILRMVLARRRRLRKEFVSP